MVTDRYYKARDDYTNNSEAILLCNRCACNWKTNSQRILQESCVQLAFTESTFFWRHLNYTKSCQQALCNRCPVQFRTSFSNNKHVCVILFFGPAPLQKCAGDFCCINSGGGVLPAIFLEDFLGPFRTDMRRKNPAGQKIREKIRRPKN